MDDHTATARDSTNAVGSALRVLLGVSGADSVSLWSATDDGPALIGAAGDVAAAEYELRHAATALLAGRGAAEPHLTAATIELDGGVRALLLARDPAAADDAHEALLRTARPALAGLLRRRAGVAPNGADDAEAAQRRLARLRYDLHDGPQQEVHLLAQDLRLFREQLAPMIGSHPDRDRALGRLDDLEAQLIALDEDLRRLATSVRSPLLVGSLAQTLVQVAEAFTARTGIVPRTELRGEIDSLTDSQQIALLSLIREALTNVRQHSDAGRVEITIVAEDEAITAQVRDDGSGFDPGLAGPRAARDGRLGLVGMHERMRMLGGRTEISSAPGGPTAVSAWLPRWPVETEAT